MRSLVLAGLVLLALAGCSSAHVAPVRHRDLTSLAWGVAGISDVSTLDPALVSDPTSIGVASLVYGGLVRLDSRLKVRPDGATRWTISPDGKTYTFALRHGLRFASGQPVTAQDFVRTLDGALGAQNTPSTAATYLNLIARDRRGVPSIRALTSSSVQITLQRPAAHFLAELAFPLSFVPDPTLQTRYGTSWTDHAAGFGPYQVETWRHSRYLRLRRNPYYFGPRPRIGTITLRFYGVQAAQRAYARGAVDLVSGFGPGDAVTSHATGLRRVHLLALDYLAFNTTKVPFRRTDARRALSAAWSPAFVIRAMGTSAFPATGLLPSAFNVKSSLWKPRQSAATYLAHAHYGGGKHFPAVTLVMPRDPNLHELGLILRRSWQRFLGVDVAVRQLTLSSYVQVLNNRAFDLAFVRWGADYPDPQDFLATQLGTSTDNVTGWAGKHYDRLVPLADSYNPLDPRRDQLFREAATIATEKVPLLPMDEPAQVALVRPALHGVVLTALGTVSLDPATAHFSK